MRIQARCCAAELSCMGMVKESAVPVFSMMQQFRGMAVRCFVFTEPRCLPGFEAKTVVLLSPTVQLVT